MFATGPKTEQLEREFAAYLGRKRAIGTNSCTAALHLGLLALGIGVGDEVITTPMTFVSTVNSIVYVGAKPVFVDVEPDTLNIDPARIEEAITEHTKAIMPVHLYGHPCEMDKIANIAKRHGLKVISDCAHAIEAEYRGKKVGSLGLIGCFSFYATKNLATGNGGMLVTDDDSVAEMVQCLRDHGMSPGAWARYHTGEFQEYPMTHLGYKYIMWDIPAALGLHQLRRLEPRHKKRLEVAARYEATLKSLDTNLEVIHPRGQIRHAYHLYVITVEFDVIGKNRSQLFNLLRDNGIGVNVHYIPVHLHPYYREKLGSAPGDCPAAELMYEKILSLPIYPSMSDAQVKEVLDKISQIIDQ